jgi:hypothetical protein
VSPPDISAAFAERMVAPSHNLVPLPDRIPAELGSLVEPLAVGFHAVRRADVAADDVVLVLGGGPIGQAAALAARRVGATDILVTEPQPQRRDLVSRLGFATTAGPVDGPPASVVIDAVGISQTLQTAFDASALGARIVLVGMGSPRIELNAYAISTEERTVLGSFSYTEAEFRDTAEWVGVHADELGMLVDARVDLADAPETFRALAARELTASKVLVFLNRPAQEEHSNERHGLCRRHGLHRPGPALANRPRSRSAAVASSPSATRPTRGLPWAPTPRWSTSPGACCCPGSRTPTCTRCGPAPTCWSATCTS